MKKNSFLFTLLLLLSVSVLTSCFSSSGKVKGPGIPKVTGFEASTIDPTKTQTIQITNSVEGIKGYAVVPKEAAVNILNQGWSGILIIFSYFEDERVTPLSDFSELKNHSFDAYTVAASCYPDKIWFYQEATKTGEYIELCVNADNATGMDLGCDLKDADEKLDVTTDAVGAHVFVPHFCDWLFSMKGSVELVNVTDTLYDTLTYRISDPNGGDIKVDQPWTGDGKKFGVQTQSCRNPFVLAYLDRLFGQLKSTRLKFDEYRPAKGVLFAIPEQKIYTFALKSGGQTFTFKAYGKPYIDGRKTVFVADQHPGGSGGN